MPTASGEEEETFDLAVFCDRVLEGLPAVSLYMAAVSQIEQCSRITMYSAGLRCIQPDESVNH